VRGSPKNEKEVDLTGGRLAESKRERGRASDRKVREGGHNYTGLVKPKKGEQLEEDGQKMLGRIISVQGRKNTSTIQGERRRAKREGLPPERG